MGTVLVTKILTDASTVLKDVKHTRWPLDELVNWLNEGLVAMVGIKPSVYTLNAPFRLAAGTRQELPAGGLQLIDVVRNMGTTGEKPGRVVRRIERDTLDTQVPDWHAKPRVGEIRHFTYEIGDLKHFYVYPPSNGGTFVELVHSACPPGVTLAQAIPVDDVYEPALLNYVLYRAKQKETEAGADSAQANAYLNACVGILTGRAQAEMAKNPNSDPDGNPNSRAPRR